MFGTLDTVGAVGREDGLAFVVGEWPSPGSDSES
uniref:Unannotated protein n=1 Tax=freshwater metagenome TaxID=449393 RepID=A0A6J6A0H3_9ZZZZ